MEYLMLSVRMTRIRTPLDAELLKGLKRILERLRTLRTSEPHDETSALRLGIHNKIAEIESSATAE